VTNRDASARTQTSSKILDRVYVSRTAKTDVVHFPPGTRFYGDPVKGSGKAHVPRRADTK
jgi:hypothetical protein